jgi:hypothetical protein
MLAASMSVSRYSVKSGSLRSTSATKLWLKTISPGSQAEGH